MSLPERAPDLRLRARVPAGPWRHRLVVAVAVLSAVALASLTARLLIDHVGAVADVASGPTASCPGSAHATGSYCPLPEVPPSGR